MAMNESLDRFRNFWGVAADFPADKSIVYAEHNAVHEFDAHTGQRVLEYGCGGGADAIAYMRRGNRVAAFDIVPKNIDRTIERTRAAGLLDWLTPHLSTVTVPLPYADGEFDIVNSTGVLHHIPDPKPVVQEFVRVLKLHGLIYIMLYTEHLWNALAAQTNALVRQQRVSREEAFGWATDGPGCPYARAYTEAEGCQLLAEAGFAILKVTPWNDSGSGAQFRTFKGQR